MSVALVAMAAVGGGYSIEAAGACTVSYNGLPLVLLIITLKLDLVDIDDCLLEGRAWCKR